MKSDLEQTLVWFSRVYHRLLRLPSPWRWGRRTSGARVTTKGRCFSAPRSLARVRRTTNCGG